MGILRALALYALGVGVLCGALFARMRPSALDRPIRVQSAWQAGQRVGRTVDGPPPACEAPCVLAVDEAVAVGPLPSSHPLIVGLSLRPELDGLEARVGDRVAYATPDDLLAARAAVGASPFGEANIKLGQSRVDRALDRLAAELGARPDQLTLRRLVFTRGAGDGRAPYPAAVDPEALTVTQLRAALSAAAHNLARNQLPNGALIYGRDVITGEVERGHSDPRIAGATLFLAEAAAELRDPKLIRAAVRAAEHLSTRLTGRCGELPCVGLAARVNIGGSGVALAAYVALVRSGLAPQMEAQVRPLAAFLRGMQRADGQFMHFYDRRAAAPIDRQTQYYTGEVALGLARAYTLTGDPADLNAARAALRYTAGPGWDFFGDRYVYANEHWSCQAIEDVWPHGAMPEVLDFCLGFSAFGRALMQPTGGDGLNPLHPPRLSGTATRAEAAIATLQVAIAAGVPAEERAALDRQARRAVAYLLGYQFTPGPRHLLADPYRVEGGWPHSAIDYGLRVDLQQHIGSAVLRYLLHLKPRRGPT